MSIVHRLRIPRLRFKYIFGANGTAWILNKVVYLGIREHQRASTSDLCEIQRQDFAEARLKPP